MVLTTLVVSDASEKTAQIEALVKENSDLELMGTSSREQAPDQIEEGQPRLVWIELTSDPESGLVLLSRLKELHPDVHYLVSNETLEADLVKNSMQLGAIDFLDASTWSDQLADVVSRVLAKEMSQQSAQKKLEADREKMREMLEQQRTSSKYVQDANMKHMRQGLAEMDEFASVNTIMFGILVLLAIGAGIAFFVLR